MATDQVRLGIIGLGAEGGMYATFLSEGKVPNMTIGAIADIDESKRAAAEKLGVPNSSLSFHLGQLREAGLVLQERQHRSIIYRANYPAMNALVAYLMENCCAGAADCGAGAACEAPAPERKSA